VTAAVVRGLTALQKRLSLAVAPKAVQRTLLQEAEAIAAGTRSRAPGELAKSVEIIDVSKGARLAYAVGTPEPAGRYLEHGTVSGALHLGSRLFSACVYHALSTLSEE
jgi:hypothetical protein